jgi:hypothetical protein
MFLTSVLEHFNVVVRFCLHTSLNSPTLVEIALLYVQGNLKSNLFWIKACNKILIYDLLVLRLL